MKRSAAPGGTGLAARRKSSASARKTTASRRSLRLTGGEWRGRRLPFVPAEGLRPTLSQGRERLFNWLQYDISGRRVLDAFAGSGILGLEALSRGAGEAVFVERNRNSAAQIRRHLGVLAAQDRATVHTVEALDWMTRQSEPFDLVFLDPPFAGELFQHSLDTLAQSACVRAGTLVYLETPRTETLQWPAGWTLYKEACKGSIHQRLLRVEPRTAEAEA